MREIEKPKHRAVMLNILRDIYNERELGAVLGFKGGTAAYLFYDLPRFSVDLDFNLLEPDELKAKRVLIGLEQIVSKYGKVIDINQKYHTLLLEINYQAEFRNLKLEISTRPDQDNFQLLDLYGVTCKVMTKDSMFARKLLALTMRSQLAARDLFDINFFLKANWPLNTQTIKEASGQSTIDYLAKVSKFIQANFNTRNVLDGVGELLVEEQRRDPKLKTELIDGTIFNLQLLAEQLA